MERHIQRGGRRSRGRGAVIGLVGSVAFAMVIGAGVLATAQEAGTGRVTAEVRDRAGLFGADAIASARGELERVARETGASIVIETVDTLDGEPFDRVALSHARASGIRGIFILIARKERKLDVLGSGHYKEVLTPAHIRAIRDAFFEGFRRQDYNEGLKRGVAELARVMASVRHVPADAPPAPAPATPSGSTTATSAMAFGPKSAGDSPLIARHQVRLTLAGARAIVAGAAAKAQAMGIKENIAVVDDGGHLIAFERMEGARPASVYTALTKATTAATLRQPTGPLPAGTTTPDLLLNLSLQNAAAASGGKITTLYGGVPVVVDGQVIGGVGVGGGTGAEDAQVARAGIQAFADQLAKPAAETKETGPQGNSSGQGKTSNAGPAGGSNGPDF
jgi:uncharacterized protein GlcG (DUF336 family)